MLIGADFFLSHRIYVASKQHKLFFTYNGGAVFNLKASPAADPAPPSAAMPVLPSAAMPAPASDLPPAESAPDEPKDAAAYSRRGTAFAARRDFQHAIADLDRACELAPDEPNYFYERGIARRDSGQPIPALADFDQAIKIKFDHVPALAARAELRLRNGDAGAAVTDLEAADQAAAKEADVRYRLGLDYQHVDLMPQSVAQYDLWIASHADDARLGAALANRMLGQGITRTGSEECPEGLRLRAEPDRQEKCRERRHFSQPRRGAPAAWGLRQSHRRLRRRAGAASRERLVAVWPGCRQDSAEVCRPGSSRHECSGGRLAFDRG
jgi:tetratricopeptide (TPR) repeat protein